MTLFSIGSTYNTLQFNYEMLSEQSPPVLITFDAFLKLVVLADQSLLSLSVDAVTLWRRHVPSVVR